MRYHRLPFHGIAIAAAVAVAISIALTTLVPAASSTREETGAPSLNRFEHEAHRSLSDTRREQARSLKAGERLARRPLAEARQARTIKPGEHLARRPLAEARQARSYNQREHLAQRDLSTATRVEGVVVSTSPSTSCADGIAQVWRGLGHFSDGYERYLLRQPPCR